MRIISGRLGGRSFDAPRGHRTHPMSDKMRGALFNMLGDVADLTVLDVFAGSGALGFEALSRGSGPVTAIESDKTAHRVIEGNARALGLGKQFKAIRASVGGWLNNNTALQFDIILADPPYDDLQINALQKLSRYLHDNGLLALSWPGHKAPPDLAGLDRLIERNYGDSQLAFYRKIGAEERTSP